MPRPARHLPAACSAASLLLCLATCAFWARSHTTLDHFMLVDLAPTGQSQRSRTLWSGRGILGLTAAHFTPQPTPGRWVYAHDQYPLTNWSRPTGTSLKSLGFGATSAGNATNGHHEIHLPHWLPASLFATLPTLHLRRSLRRHHRHTHHLCPTCGYDLRASPRRCPECGTTPTARSAAASAPPDPRDAISV